MAKREWLVGWESRLLILITAVLVVFGLASIYSASATLIEKGRVVGTSLVLDQLLGALAGGLLLLVAARIDLERVKALAWPIVLVTGGMLLLLVLPFTHAIAPRINGSRRWLQLGVSVQVSELAKLAIIIWTAMLCAKKGTEVRRMRRGLLPVLAVVGPLAILLIIQPDLSSALEIGLLAMVVLFAAGARIGHFILLGVVAMPVLWQRVEDAQYQLLRMTTFLDPGADRLGAGYQVDQSLIGLGAGKLVGVGFGQGQQKLGFLPYPYSDFIFGTIGEEWGFIGVVFLSVLYTLFVLVALRLARAAGDPFRQYLAAGLTVMIGVDAFTHMGVGLGILPTTGLVLPFVSYGRSSLVVALIATGLLINVGTRRRAKVA
ncbi:MAG: putative peptidoglycan glycosyltransferase FtsW [Gemmatimonadales bacterium]